MRRRQKRTQRLPIMITFFELGARCAAPSIVNLPGWRWAGIKQLALVGSSSSLHSEACKALGGSDGVVHSRISGSDGCVRAAVNNTLFPPTI
jgi:hypothetical protein